MAPTWSLSLKSAAAARAAPAPPKRLALADEEDDALAAPRPSSSKPVPVSKAVRRQHEAAEQLDASAFDYDGVYDQMKQVERELQQAKKESNKTRAPKYMTQFMEAAEQRERDRLRAEAKMLQRQREAEGDEFAGKEAFVTSAYKEQQEALQRAEAEENLREAREREKSRGVASFHQAMLADESRKRQLAVEALAKRAAAPAAPAAEEEMTDERRAAQAQARGLRVELNDDRQIVDQRDLLQRGLNVVRKRKEPASAPEAPPPASDRAKRSQLMEEALLAKLGASSDDSDDD